MQYGLAGVTMLGVFGGSLWLSLDGIDMGRASVMPGVRTRQLGIGVSDLPASATVEVVRGRVAYGRGTTITQPDSGVVATLTGANLASGNAELMVRTDGSCFFYLRVRDRGGAVVGFTNPVMHLASQPPSRGAVSDRRLI